MFVYMYMYVGYVMVMTCGDDSVVSDDSVTQLNALLADTGVPLLDVNSGQYTLRACVCHSYAFTLF